MNIKIKCMCGNELEAKDCFINTTRATITITPCSNDDCRDCSNCEEVPKLRRAIEESLVDRTDCSHCEDLAILKDEITDLKTKLEK